MNKPSTPKGISLLALGMDSSSRIEPEEEACHE